MSVTDQLRSVVRLEYLLVKSCVASVDRHLVHPIEGRSAGLDSVLARIRTLVEDVDDRLSGPGQPQERWVATPDAPAPATDDSSAVLSPDEVDEVEELAEDYLEAEADHVTGELADNDELRRVQAELRAKHTLQERDEQH